jgi:GST-like protein
MIALHFWPIPNGKKIALEDLERPYRLLPVDIGQGQRFNPGFLAISPNNRIPAIVDDAPNDGVPPVSVFESGAILVYLAERTGRLVPGDFRALVVGDRHRNPEGPDELGEGELLR